MRWSFAKILSHYGKNSRKPIFFSFQRSLYGNVKYNLPCIVPSFPRHCMRRPQKILDKTLNRPNHHSRWRAMRDTRNNLLRFKFNADLSRSLANESLQANNVFGNPQRYSPNLSILLSFTIQPLEFFFFNRIFHSFDVNKFGILIFAIFLRVARRRFRITRDSDVLEKLRRFGERAETRGGVPGVSRWIFVRRFLGCGKAGTLSYGSGKGTEWRVTVKTRPNHYFLDSPLLGFWNSLLLQERSDALRSIPLQYFSWIRWIEALLKIIIGEIFTSKARCFPTLWSKNSLSLSHA